MLLRLEAKQIIHKKRPCGLAPSRAARGSLAEKMPPLRNETQFSLCSRGRAPAALSRRLAAKNLRPQKNLARSCSPLSAAIRHRSRQAGCCCGGARVLPLPLRLPGPQLLGRCARPLRHANAALPAQSAPLIFTRPARCTAAALQGGRGRREQGSSWSHARVCPEQWQRGGAARSALGLAAHYPPTQKKAAGTARLRSQLLAAAGRPPRLLHKRSLQQHLPQPARWRAPFVLGGGGAALGVLPLSPRRCPTPFSPLAAKTMRWAVIV